MTAEEKQQEIRMTLFKWAKYARVNGFSMLEWQEHPDVIEACKQAGLTEDLLEHIVWVVWKPTE